MPAVFINEVILYSFQFAIILNRKQWKEIFKNFICLLIISEEELLILEFRGNLLS